MDGKITSDFVAVAVLSIGESGTVQVVIWKGNLKLC
jgi:hypothetical protein